MASMEVSYSFQVIAMSQMDINSRTAPLPIMQCLIRIDPFGVVNVLDHSDVNCARSHHCLSDLFGLIKVISSSIFSTLLNFHVSNFSSLMPSFCII